ncbi:MAG: FAD-binding oxidoreductase [Bacteroidota bacterium]
MTKQKTTYFSYGNVHRSQAEVYYPKTLSELKAILAFCKKENRKITPAGSFHSFDQQNSGNDVVISFIHFDKLTYHASDHTITVGAGAKWGAILEAAYQNKCLVPTCITCSQPTAAGTLSVQAHSMWSPGNGKDGNQCVALELMTTEGDLLHCSRTENSDLFYGVVSGMGMLGFIVSIKYQLFYVGQDYEIKIHTTQSDDIKNIEQKLDLRMAKQFTQLKDFQSQSTLFYLENGAPKFTVYNREYELVERRRGESTFRFYQSVVANGAIRLFPSLVNQVLIRDARRSDANKWLLQGLRSVTRGTFWAESEYYWTKYLSKVIRPFGYQTQLYQMTYFIPFGGDQVSAFTEVAYDLMQQHELKFCMFDIMYVPKDEPFVFSTSRWSDGFHVNLTFMDYIDREKLMRFFAQLNELAAELKGKIYLAKNCFVESSLLEEMHRPEIEEFVQLKQKYDPNGRLISNYLENHFPSYFPKTTA